MLNSRVGRIAALAVPLACAATASGQDQLPPLYQVVRVVDKPERSAECRELRKKFSQAHEKAGAGFRHVWRNMHNPFEYTVVTPRKNYATFDQPGPAAKSMSEAERARLVERRNQCAESVHITIQRPIPELSIPWSGSEPPRMVQTVKHQIRPGTHDEYLELQKRLVDALKRHGFEGHGAYHILWGGKRTTILTWSAMESMSELDDAPAPLPGRVMKGEELTAWFEEAQPLVETAVEFEIWVYEPELSFHGAE